MPGGAGRDGESGPAGCQIEAGGWRRGVGKVARDGDEGMRGEKMQEGNEMGGDRDIRQVCLCVCVSEGVCVCVPGQQ